MGTIISKLDQYFSFYNCKGNINPLIIKHLKNYLKNSIKLLKVLKNVYFAMLR